MGPALVEGTLSNAAGGEERASPLPAVAHALCRVLPSKMKSQFEVTEAQLFVALRRALGSKMLRKRLGADVSSARQCIEGSAAASLDGGHPSTRRIRLSHLAACASRASAVLAFDDEDPARARDEDLAVQREVAASCVQRDSAGLAITLLLALLETSAATAGLPQPACTAKEVAVREQAAGLLLAARAITHMPLSKACDMAPGEKHRRFATVLAAAFRGRSEAKAECSAARGSDDVGGGGGSQGLDLPSSPASPTRAGRRRGGRRTGERVVGGGGAPAVARRLGDLGVAELSMAVVALLVEELVPGYRRARGRWLAARRSEGGKRWRHKALTLEKRKGFRADLATNKRLVEMVRASRAEALGVSDEEEDEEETGAGGRMETVGGGGDALHAARQTRGKNKGNADGELQTMGPLQRGALGHASPGKPNSRRGDEWSRALLSAPGQIKGAAAASVLMAAAADAAKIEAAAAAGRGDDQEEGFRVSG